METKWTQGPWAVTMEQRWPFDIAIAPNVVLMGRIAYSTAQTSLADVRKAVGFKRNQREETVRLVAEQEANAYLIAAAPDLADLAFAYERWEADVIINSDWTHDTPRLTQAQLDDLLRIQGLRNAALAKARGEE